jgi:hypothetical protein
VKWSYPNPHEKVWIILKEKHFHIPDIKARMVGGGVAPVKT